MPKDFSACSASSAFKRRIFSQAVSRLTFGLIVAYFKSRVGRAYSDRPRESTEGRPQSQIPGEVGWKGGAGLRACEETVNRGERRDRGEENAKTIRRARRARRARR